MRLGVVYKLSFKNCKYFLFGSSINFHQRKIVYYSDLKRGDYANSFLQAVYNKYGKENIVFEIMQDNIPEDILTNIENIWIGANCAKASDQKNGMNIADADKKIFSKETKKKMSETRKTLIKNDVNFLNNLRKSHKEYVKNRTFEPIIALFKNGNIEEYKSVKEVAKQFNVQISLINGIIRKLYKCHKNKVTFFKKKEFDSKLDYNYLFNRKMVSVLQYSLNGEFINEWESAKIAGDKLNITPSTITLCCKGIYKQGKGFIWKYKNK